MNNTNRVSRTPRSITAKCLNRILGDGRLAFLVILFTLCPMLPAQNGSGEGFDYDGRAIVGILPLTGEEDAADIFYEAVTAAVDRLQKYSSRDITLDTLQVLGLEIPTDMPPVKEVVPGVRYALTGGVYPGNNANEYYLQLWLWNMVNSTMIYTDDLVYQDIEEGLPAVPGLVEWLFSHIIEKSESEPDGWKETWLSVGVRAGGSQRWYTTPKETSPGAQALNFEGGLFVAVRMLSLLSFQAEMLFTWDNVVYRGVTDIGPEEVYDPVLANEKHTAYSIMLPLLLKLNLATNRVRFSPFAGVYAFIPLGETEYRMNPTGQEGDYSWSVSVPMGFAVGLETAIKAGPGLIIGDIRYSGDFGDTTIHDSSVQRLREDTVYRRGGLSFSLGYAFGFINVKKR
ncbi:MAG: hypothetical protein LBD47_07505 [Treponema sp.]|nr:hypothetical protein [Treponema sp.]